MWQLNYMGEGKYFCRHLGLNDRKQAIPKEVERCANLPDCKTALIGGHWPLENMQNHPKFNDWLAKINNRYFIIESPERSLLDLANFEFPEK